MSKRFKKEFCKIKASDGDEFEVEDDVVKKMETLTTLTMLGEGDQMDPVSELFQGDGFKGDF